MLFCGDGLNDLAALGTAEVGMAIGPIDAMAAAPVSTKQSSIAGTALHECMSANPKMIHQKITFCMMRNGSLCNPLSVDHRVLHSRHSPP